MATLTKLYAPSLLLPYPLCLSLNYPLSLLLPYPLRFVYPITLFYQKIALLDLLGTIASGIVPVIYCSKFPSAFPGSSPGGVCAVTLPVVQVTYFRDVCWIL